MPGERTTAGQTLLKSKAWLFAVAVGAFFVAGRLATEHVLLSQARWPRRVARRAFRQRLRLLDRFVDPEIYPRQFPSRRRTAVARDPALHYALVGRFHDFAPNRDFDPVYYRCNTPELNWFEDPLAHFVERTDGRMATRELPGPAPLSASLAPPVETVVTINHGRGGGSTTFLSLYESFLNAKGIATLRLVRVSNKQPLFRFMQDTTIAGEATFHVDEDEAQLAEALVRMGATRLVINHFIDIADGFDKIPRVARLAGIPFDVILHDYFTACPRIFLVDRSQRFCNQPPEAVCTQCLRGHAGRDIARHRDAAGRMLHAADRVIVPSRDVADRLTKYWPDRIMEVWNPEDDRLLGAERLPRLRPDEKLRVAIIGGLSVFKGYNLVKSLAHSIKSGNLPIELTLIGSSENDLELASSGVVVHGRYRDSTIDRLIATYRPHVALLPSICPETWSFTLTIALRNHLHVTALDIGAPADRLRRLKRGALLPHDIADQPSLLTRHFLGLRDQLIASATAQVAAPDVIRDLTVAHSRQL